MSTVSAVAKTSKETVNACTLVDLNVNVINLQPDLNIPKVPDLTKVQRDVKKHVKKWPALWNSIYKTSMDIIDYSQFFNNVTDTLIGKNGLVEILEDPKATPEQKARAKQEIIQALTEGLIPRVNEKIDNVNKVRDGSKAFHDSFIPDSQLLKKAIEEAKKAIHSNDIHILDLNKSIEVKETELNQLQKELIGIGAGIGASVVVPLFGTIGVIGLATAEAVISAKYIDKMKAIFKDQEKLGKLQAEVATLLNVETVIGNYRFGVENIITGSDALYKAWIIVRQSLQNTVSNAEAAKESEVAVLIRADLETMNDAWQDTLKQVESILPNGGVIPFKQYTSPEEYLKEMEQKLKEKITDH